MRQKQWSVRHLYSRCGKRKDEEMRMKQMRHILYVTEPDLALKIEGQALCAVHSGGRKDKIPFHLLEGIVSFSYASITPAVMTECAR